MPYAAKDDGKPIGMQGVSDTLPRNSFELYRGYVTNTNKAPESLAAMLSEEDSIPAFFGNIDWKAAEARLA